MAKLIIIMCILYPTLLLSQLNYYYKSSEDNFTVKFPEKPEIKELKWEAKIGEGETKLILARNYKSSELFQNSFTMYDITYTQNYDRSPIEFKKDELKTALSNFLQGLISNLHSNPEIEISKNFEYNQKYPGIEYKIRFSLEGEKMYKEGFFVLKNGKFINIAIMYDAKNEKLNKKRYQTFIKSFKF